MELVDIAAPVPRRTAATTRQALLLLSASVIATASAVSRPMIPARSVELLLVLVLRPEQTAASRRPCSPIPGGEGTAVQAYRARSGFLGAEGSLPLHRVSPSLARCFFPRVPPCVRPSY